MEINLNNFYYYNNYVIPPHEYSIRIARSFSYSKNKRAPRCNKRFNFDVEASPNQY